MRSFISLFSLLLFLISFPVYSLDFTSSYGGYVGYPLIASGEYSFLTGGKKGDEMGSYHSGLITSLEGGIGGGKVSIGYGMKGLAGISLSGSAMRTWLTSYLLEQNENYLGGELQLNLIIFSLKMGAFHNLTSEKNTTYSFSLGLLFNSF